VTASKAHASGDGLDDTRVCVCSRHDCTTSFEAESVVALARKVTRHWNENHGDVLQHNYDVFHSEERGGDRIHENVYQIRRHEYYVTVYDVLATGRSRPISEEFAVADDPKTCRDCWRFVPAASDRVGADHVSGVNVTLRYRCVTCHEERETSEKSEQNFQITDFDAGDGNE
jgi:hypothetical protein